MPYSVSRTPLLTPEDVKKGKRAMCPTGSHAYQNGVDACSKRRVMQEYMPFLAFHTWISGTLTRSICKGTFDGAVVRGDGKRADRSSVIQYRILSEYICCRSRRPLIVLVWWCGPMWWYVFLLFWLVDVQWLGRCLSGVPKLHTVPVRRWRRCEVCAVHTRIAGDMSNWWFLWWRFGV